MFVYIYIYIHSFLYLFMLYIYRNIPTTILITVLGASCHHIWVIGFSGFQLHRKLKAWVLPGTILGVCGMYCMAPIT